MRSPANRSPLRNLAEDRPAADELQANLAAQEEQLRELQASQIELETRNEALRQTLATTEAALARYTELHDNAPVACFSLDNSGTIQHGNLAGARLLNPEQGFLTNASFAAFIAANDRPGFEEFLQKVFAARLHQSCEIVLATARQPADFMQIVATRTSHELCNIVAMNITTRVLAEQRFSALFGHNPDAIAITSCEQNGFIIDINPVFCRIFGYSRQELIGQHTHVINLWNNDALEKAAIAQLLQDVPIEDQQNSVRARNGQMISTSLSGCRIDIAGLPCLLLIYRDTSERMQQQQRLQDSEARWRFAIEGHGDALWDWDVSNARIYRSPHWLELLGAPAAATECTLELHNRCIHPEDRASVNAEHRQLLRGRVEELRSECRLLRPDGTIIWIAYRSRVMQRDAAGRATRVIGTIRDITLEIERQARMEAQINKLSHQARLLSLGEMASATAHEINQPLTAIAQYAAVCARQLKDRPLTCELVQRIEKQALRAGNIVWRMRDFAKHRTAECQQISIGQITADVFEWLSWERRTRDVEFLSTFPENLPAIMGDRVQIEQVLLNLIWNGIQAMQGMPGKLRIEVTANVDAARNMLVVSVADRGCGLPDPVALDLFTPFASSKPDGLGLGLAISRTLIDNHGGQIWSAPRENGGTVFSFSLPLAQPAEKSVSADDPGQNCPDSPQKGQA